MQNSILSFEFQSKEEALNIMDLYVDKAQSISFYSYYENPYKYEYNTIHPTQQVGSKEATSMAPCSFRYICDLYLREEDAVAFYSYRTPVRNNRYFARK